MDLSPGLTAATPVQLRTCHSPLDHLPGRHYADRGPFVPFLDFWRTAMLRNWLLAVALVGCNVALARAAVKTKTVTYQHGGMTFKGHLAWDDTVKGKRPGILVVHEFWGLNDYARRRAEQLAGLGYVAFACDMYGGGKVTTHPEDAARMAGEVRKNVKAWQGRAQAALDVLKGQEQVDPKKLAAIGYCFGGSTALELAYSGADLKAVVTFHAALPVPEPEQAMA